MGAYKDPKRGTWYAAFYYKDWTGKRRHKVKRGFKTMREAKEWERNFLSTKASSIDMTLGALIQVYLEDMELRLKPTTMDTKRWNIETWILPTLKDVPIKDISVRTVREWQNHLLGSKKEDGEPLAPTYVRTIHSQLSCIMNYAVKNYGLPMNPCRVAGTIGKSDSEEMHFWTVDEFTMFREHEQKRAFGLAFDILFYTGIRAGELLALSPDRFTADLMLHVNRNYASVKNKQLLLTPKTEESTRDISIPQFLYDEVLTYCEDIACGPDELIFYFTKQAINREIHRVAKLAGLQEIRVHDLRHSHVAMLIDQGIPMKEIQARMGHKSITTTMDTYGHLYKDRRGAIGEHLQNMHEAAEASRKKKDDADREGTGNLTEK